MQIQITSRHGNLGPEQQAFLTEKAGKLQKYFVRLMAIAVQVDLQKKDWTVEIQVSAEHKHDFVARETGATLEAAADSCVHKLETQLRKYKEKVQNHKNATPQGGTSPDRPDLPEPPTAP